MAVPTLATDLTQLDSCDTDTNIGEWGIASGKSALDADINIEGTNCVGLSNRSTGDGGYGPVGFTSINLSTNLLIIWVYIAEKGFLNTYGGGTISGLYVRIGSGGDFTDDYGDFWIGGSDTEWCTGGWRPVVIDTNRGEDGVSATAPDYTVVNAIALGGDYVATSSKSSVTAIDNICYGNYVEYTGVASSSAQHSFTSPTTITRGADSFIDDGFEVGDTIVISNTASNDGEYTLTAVNALTMNAAGITTEGAIGSDIDAYLTFEDLYNKDNNSTDDTWYASVTKNRDGVYEINYDLRIGDQSGTVNTYFRSRNEQVMFADQPLDTSATTALRLKTYEDTGETVFEFGNSTGTGDSRVGFAGTIFGQTNTQFSENGLVDLSTAITTCNVFGTTFQGVGLGVDFSTPTSHFVTNTTFASCGPIDLGAVEARNLTFSGYSGTDGALNWNSSIDIENSSFLANLNSGGTAHAILHDTASTYTYTGLSFAGNDYDVENSSAGVVNINVSGTGAASTAENTGGGSTNFIASVNISANVVNSGGTDIENAQVYIQKSATGKQWNYVSHSGNALNNVDFVVTGAIDVDLPSAGWVHVWDKSDNTKQNYRYTAWSTSTDTTFTLKTNVTGSATSEDGTSPQTKLISSSSNFLTMKTAGTIEEGDTIYNSTDLSWAIVDEIVDADNVTTSALQGGTDDKWQASDGFSLHKLVKNYTITDDKVDVPLFNGQTDASGDISTSYNWGVIGAVLPIIVRVRSNYGTPKYVPYDTSGSITGNGYSTTMVLTEDTVAS